MMTTSTKRLSFKRFSVKTFIVFALATVPVVGLTTAPVPAAHATDLAVHNQAVNDAEQKYAANSYRGAGAPDSVKFVDRTSTSDILIVAPHAVKHHRAGGPKKADKYTGGIAEAVADQIGASVLNVTGEVGDWGDDWGKRNDQFTQVLKNLPPNIKVVDLHGMDDGNNIPASVGTGPQPNQATMDWANKILSGMGSNARQNGASFAATAGYTDTSFLQANGHVAVQLELSEEVRQSEDVVGMVANAVR